jgi:hypothetical protein
MVALIHPTENSPMSKVEFLQANGIAAVVVATVNIVGRGMVTVVRMRPH